MNKPYNVGVVCGRFQTFHRGHEAMIRKALSICETVIVCIGSAQEFGTQKNPFNCITRIQMLKTVFAEEYDANRLFIVPLKDIGAGNNTDWGEYMLGEIKQITGLTPEITISGKESRRLSWFDDTIAELYIPKILDISAEKLRHLMLIDYRTEWEKYVPDKLTTMYLDLRAILLKSQANTYTNSI